MYLPWVKSTPQLAQAHSACMTELYVHLKLLCSTAAGAPINSGCVPCFFCFQDHLQVGEQGD